MPDTKRVLILTADAGFGHRSAANAVKAALEELFDECCQVEIVNPLDDPRTPFFLRDSQADYDTIIKRAPAPGPDARCRVSAPPNNAPASAPRLATDAKTRNTPASPAPLCTGL